MKTALFGKTFTEDNLPHIKNFIERLAEESAHVLCYRPWYELLAKHVRFPKEISFFTGDDDLKGKADLLVNMGGDGTFLETVRFVRDSGIPVIGINTGRLGFLSSVTIEDAVKAIDALKNANYTIEKRTLIRLKAKNNPFGIVNYGLNEITALKKNLSLITIHVYVNNEFLNSYWADGLIVSTPTGSTAYSLSCGGPILTPASENFIITPIAPHNLNVRPVVLPDSVTIRLKIESRDQQYLAALDSRSATFETSAELTISKCRFSFHLIRLTDQNFFTMLRNKLMVGMDKRK